MALISGKWSGLNREKFLWVSPVTQGRLMWPGPDLETLGIARRYIPGDAWFSSTDGEHDAPSYVHFPRMKCFDSLLIKTSVLM